MQIEGIKLTPVVSSATSQLGGDKPAETKGFGQYLGEALQNVNSLQAKAKQEDIKQAAGLVEDLSQVVIASEKASIALQLTMQVRNKALDAYQEIMRMQV